MHTIVLEGAGANEPEYWWENINPVVETTTTTRRMIEKGMNPSLIVDLRSFIKEEVINLHLM